MVEINRPPRVMFKVSFEMFSQSYACPAQEKIKLGWSWNFSRKQILILGRSSWVGLQKAKKLTEMESGTDEYDLRTSLLWSSGWSLRLPWHWQRLPMGHTVWPTCQYAAAVFLSRLFHKYWWVLVWKPIYSLLLCFYRHIKHKIILLNLNCLNCDFHLSGIPCTGKKT